MNEQDMKIKPKCAKLLSRLPRMFGPVSESNRATMLCNIFIFNTGAKNT